MFFIMKSMNEFLNIILSEKRYKYVFVDLLFSVQCSEQFTRNVI